MMKKQYSFRIKDTDEELGNFIQKLSNRFGSESEAIRQMLLYAHRHLLAESEQSKQISQIQQDLQRLIEYQDKNTSEILKSIENANIIGNEAPKESIEKEDEVNEIAQDTAAALLGGFGISFD